MSSKSGATYSKKKRLNFRNSDASQFIEQELKNYKKVKHVNEPY